MKYLLLISILLLTGCTQYSYTVKMTPCKNLTGSKLTMIVKASFSGSTEPYIEDKIVYLKSYAGEKQSWGDMCDFSYTRSEILTK